MNDAIGILERADTGLTHAQTAGHLLFHRDLAGDAVARAQILQQAQQPRRPTGIKCIDPPGGGPGFDQGAQRIGRGGAVFCCAMRASGASVASPTPRASSNRSCQSSAMVKP